MSQPLTVDTALSADVADDAVGVLRLARAHRAAEEQAGRDLLRSVLQWAGIHAVDADSDDACAVYECGEWWPIAGAGAPATSEVATAELAAALGLSTDAGRRLVGDVLELAHRLRGCWARVMADEVPGWRARQVAQATKQLSAEAAAYVDRQVAPVLGRVGVRTLGRLVEEAVARFDPEHARRLQAWAEDARGVRIDTGQVSFYGTCRVEADLDLADAFDLETAVAAGAEQLKLLGSADTLDGRRASAVGEMARTQLSFLFEDPSSGQGDPAPADGSAGPARRRPGKRLRRRLTLTVHLAEAALRSPAACAVCGTVPTDVARVESAGNALVLAEQVKAWAGDPEARITVRPVIDLAEHVRVDAYEIPDRIREQVALRDGTCVFPWCTRPARDFSVHGHDADCDHIEPWRQDGSGGETCTCSLAPVCRTHHRYKTHHGWSYQRLDETTYLWRSPHGLLFLRDHTGTTPAGDLLPRRRRRPADGDGGEDEHRRR
ncbi:HNH endonuclease [Nocardioides rotundus]|uniref:HNH endonuclease signature motif containing protein n=1 Tax=Nocardioides rotundus TaxID=1774216 RepID=UPI001CBF62D7|nr:HNH endonuclease signature motif containing protein [Nocardioides rotundus]UAL30982.1 HNH endonuclease [Nocardioides rotundus]